MANQIYRAVGTSVTFTDSTGDVTFTLANLGFGAGRVSAQYDRGVGSLPNRYLWKGVFQFNTAPAIGEYVHIYLYESDGTYLDGNVGTSDAVLGSDKRNNGKRIGLVVVDTTSTATNIIASGICTIEQRYVSVGVWNGSAGDNLQNTANASRVILTPYPYEIQ